MALFNDAYCPVCDRFITKEHWNKHLYSGRHLHREAVLYWPAFFPQRRLTWDEGSILEKAFWEVIFGSKDVLPVYEISKTSFRMCSNLNCYVSVLPWFDDEDEEEQWGYGFRDDMIAQFKQDL